MNKKWLVLVSFFLIGIALYSAFSYAPTVNKIEKQIEEELTKLKQLDEAEFITKSENYNAKLYIEFNGSNGPSIFFELQIDEPKTYLGDMMIVASFNEKLRNVINLNGLMKNFLTNVGSPTTLMPNHEMKGIGIGFTTSQLDRKDTNKRSYSEEELLAILSDVKVRVEWFDENGRVMVEYLKLQENDIILDKDFYRYFRN